MNFIKNLLAFVFKIFIVPFQKLGFYYQLSLFSLKKVDFLTRRLESRLAFKKEWNIILHEEQKEEIRNMNLLKKEREDLFLEYLKIMRFQYFLILKSKVSNLTMDHFQIENQLKLIPGIKDSKLFARSKLESNFYNLKLF